MDSIRRFFGLTPSRRQNTQPRSPATAPTAPATDILTAPPRARLVGETSQSASALRAPAPARPTPAEASTLPSIPPAVASSVVETVVASPQAQPEEETFATRLESVLNLGAMDLDAQVETLQTLMANAGAEQLDELATVVARLCSGELVHPSSLITFLWLRKYLPTAIASVSNNNVFLSASESAYYEFKNLFEGDNLVPLIMSGRGAVETTLLKVAAKCVREGQSGRHGFGLEYSCKRLFRQNYVKSAVAGNLKPVQEHKMRALLVLGQSLYVGDYNGPEFSEAVENAKSICSLIGVDYDSLVQSDPEHDYSDEVWYQLGLVYSAGCRYVAEHPEIEEQRSCVENEYRHSSLPYPFLNVAMSCFSGGHGYKIARFHPPMEKLYECQRGEEAGHQQRCIEVAAQVQEAATAALGGPGLTPDQMIALAHISNQHWDGPVDRAQLAQTLNAAGSRQDILPVFELAREIGGRRFGSDFQMAAMRAIGRMSAYERTNLRAALAPLLAVTNDEEATAQSILSVLGMSLSARTGGLQNHIDQASRRAEMREFLAPLEVAGLEAHEIEALVRAAGTAPAYQKASIRRMCAAIAGRVDAPEYLVAQLVRSRAGWNEVEPYFERLADVIFDTSSLAQQTLVMIRASSSEREALCSTEVARILGVSTLEEALAAPEYAGLSGSQRQRVITKLNRLPPGECFNVLEICRPMIERLSWNAAEQGIDEVVAAAPAERLNKRNAILRQFEHADAENVMNKRAQDQVRAAVRTMRGHLPTGFPDAATRARIMGAVESHVFGYFPKLSTTQTRALLQKATIMHASPHLRSKRDTAVTALQNAFSPDVPAGERAALMNLRADAPQLANAWRTLMGDYLDQDHSESLSTSRGNTFANTDMGDLAAMVWQLIEDFPTYAKNNPLLDAASIAREQTDMRYSFVMALAQSIDEEHNQRVCGVGLSQRLCTVLQGASRYKGVNIDLMTPAQRFTLKLAEMYEELYGDDDMEVTTVDNFLKALCKDAAADERDWYRGELGRYCTVAGWPQPSPSGQ